MRKDPWNYLEREAASLSRRSFKIPHIHRPKALSVSETKGFVAMKNEILYLMIVQKAIRLC